LGEVAADDSGERAFDEQEQREAGVVEPGSGAGGLDVQAEGQEDDGDGETDGERERGAVPVQGSAAAWDVTCRSQPLSTAIGPATDPSALRLQMSPSTPAPLGGPLLRK
jgi:hypothetical protein